MKRKRDKKAAWQGHEGTTRGKKMVFVKKSERKGRPKKKSKGKSEGYTGKEFGEN